MISILQENSFFIALHKPSGISIHNESPSLADWLKEQQKPLHFVNRLDSMTSGIVIVAQKPEFHESLHQALQNGTKKYRALLRGSWKQASKEVIWNLPLTDQSEGRKNPQGKSADRKPCLTEVFMVRTNSYFTEVICHLKTGRQHQIRKHAALAHHPIVGDDRYNDNKYNQKIFSIYKNPRLYLQAEELIFNFEKKSFHIKTETLNCDSFFKSSGTD